MMLMKLKIKIGTITAIVASLLISPPLMATNKNLEKLSDLLAENPQSTLISPLNS